MKDMIKQSVENVIYKYNEISKKAEEKTETTDDVY